jgi:hypothetical protein
MPGSTILLDIPITFEAGAGRTHAPMVVARVSDVTTKLILDTGSTDHVLTIELAYAAGLTAEPGEPGTDHAGAEVPSWTLGTVPATIGDLGVTLHDAVAIAGPAPFEAWGVGGFLSPQRVHPTAHAVVDLVDDRFILLDGAVAAARAWLMARSPNLVTLTLPRAATEQTPVVDAAIEPFPAVPTMLNTGGRGTEFATAAVPGLHGTAPDRLGLGVGGSAVPGSEVAGRTLRVGDARLPIPKLLVRNEIDSMLGLIGMDVLRGTVLMVSADPARGVLWLVPATPDARHGRADRADP